MRIDIREKTDIANVLPGSYSDMACSSARKAASVRVKPHRLHSSRSPPGRGATVPKHSGWGQVYLRNPIRSELHDSARCAALPHDRVHGTHVQRQE